MDIFLAYTPHPQATYNPSIHPLSFTSATFNDEDE